MTVSPVHDSSVTARTEGGHLLECTCGWSGRLNAGHNNSDAFRQRWNLHLRRSGEDPTGQPEPEWLTRMHDAEIHEFVDRTRTAQGLPYHVEDPATLQRVARLLLQGLEDG